MLGKYGIKSFIVIVTLVAVISLPVISTAVVILPYPKVFKVVQSASDNLTSLVAMISKRIDQLEAKGKNTKWEEDLLRQAKDIQEVLLVALDNPPDDKISRPIPIPPVEGKISVPHVNDFKGKGKAGRSNLGATQ